MNTDQHLLTNYCLNTHTPFSAYPHTVSLHNTTGCSDNSTLQTPLRRRRRIISRKRDHKGTEQRISSYSSSLFLQQVFSVRNFLASGGDVSLQPLI